MGSRNLRERNRTRTHDDIVEAALTMFEQQGYDATTCEDIASAAGLAVRTFYRYFDGKAEVLVAGRTDNNGPLAALAELRDRPPTDSPVDAIRHALEHPIRVAEAQRAVVARQFRVIMDTPTLQGFRREAFHRFEDPFAAAIAARLDLDPADLAPQWLAASAATALRLSIERWVTTGAEPGTLGPLVDETLDYVRSGFGDQRPLKA